MEAGESHDDFIYTPLSSLSFLPGALVTSRILVRVLCSLQMTPNAVHARALQL